MEFANWVDEVYDVIECGNDTGVSTNDIMAESYNHYDFHTAWENGEEAHEVADNCYSILFSSNYGIGGGEYV
jgi:hypothetical protein